MRVEFRFTVTTQFSLKQFSPLECLKPVFELRAKKIENKKMPSKKNIFFPKSMLFEQSKILFFSKYYF